MIVTYNNEGSEVLEFNDCVIAVQTEDCGLEDEESNKCLLVCGAVLSSARVEELVAHLREWLRTGSFMGDE